jgi:hypothetical protein
VKRAEANSQDPLALTLAGAALYRHDTPRAITLLMKARAIAPEFPWSAFKLAEIYSTGRYQGLEKARTYFRTYADLCGGNISSSVDWVMGRVATAEDQAEIARRIRARLESESSPEARDFERLWALEFRTRPPQDHPALRKQVARDVQRLLSLKPDKRALAVILSGMEQSGASREELAAFEERVLKEAPASRAAYTIASDRWAKNNKAPDDHKDTAAWEKWNAAYRAALKEWAAQFTDESWLPDSYLKASIEAGEMSESEAVRAMEPSVHKSETQTGGGLGAYIDAARPLLMKGWAPAKTAEWLEKAWLHAETLDRWNLEDDTLTDERRKEIAGAPGNRGYFTPDLLRAFHAAGRSGRPQHRLTRVFPAGPFHSGAGAAVFPRQTRRSTTR